MSVCFRCYGPTMAACGPDRAAGGQQQCSTQTPPPHVVQRVRGQGHPGTKPYGESPSCRCQLKQVSLCWQPAAHPTRRGVRPQVAAPGGGVRQHPQGTSAPPPPNPSHEHLPLPQCHSQAPDLYSPPLMAEIQCSRFGRPESARTPPFVF